MLNIHAKLFLSQLEHELNDSNRRIVFMEDLLKKANEECDAAKDSLKKIHLIPELDEIRGRRTRSVSPGKIVIFYFPEME